MLDLDFKSGIKVKNKTVTIDLAGYTLDRDLSSVRNSGHVIEVFDGAELTITDSSENKTGEICGGYSKWGGGIFVNENATLIIRGGTITGNTAGERGGGIYAKKNSTVVIEGGAIANNETKNKAGGGIYVLGKLTMTGGRIEGNEANESGGGIFAGEESFISLTDAVITGNKAGENGGGINVKSQTGSIIKNCEITGNRAHKYGGGLYVDEEGRTLTIIGARTKIDDNKASGAYGS
jgi:predicted outer membrane repeat protein